MIPGPFQRLQSSLDAIGTRALRTVTENARASVLIMLSNTDNPDITFTERAHTLRHHPGQLAFPGGRRDATDRGPVDTAVREAREEIGLDPSGLHVIGTMPRADLPVSSFTVVPVVGWWDGRQPVAPVDLGEVASVHRWTIEALADPSHRVTWSLGSGRTGPAWQFGEFFCGVSPRSSSIGCWSSAAGRNPGTPGVWCRCRTGSATTGRRQAADGQLSRRRGSERVG